MNELIMEKLTQIALVLSGGVIWFFNQVDGSLVSKAFDQLFSLGLLVLVVVMLYREWKSSTRYNRDRDERIEALVEANTRALEGIRTSVDRNTKALQELENKFND